MLKPQLKQSHSLLNVFPIQKPFIHGDSANHSSSSAYALTILRQHTSFAKKSTTTGARSTSIAGNIKAISIPFLTKETTVKCVITILPTIGSTLDGISNAGVSLGGVTDVVSDLLGRSFLLELVSNDLDSNGNQKTLRAYARYEALDFDISIYTYKCNFDVPEDFGEIGAVLVENEYSKKMFFKNIVLDNGVTFTCESWVHSKNDNPDKRIFFADKSYLPSETPNGLKSLREQDMESLRGNGEGERKSFERIYDYDVYNDLGAPDEELSLARPVLGGEKHPYPRRCRTGRKMSSIDQLTETRTALPFYIPADEDFSEIKQATFGAKTLYTALHAVVPLLESVFTDTTEGFPLFTDIDMLFNQGVNVPAPDDGILSVFPALLKKTDDTKNAVIQFETPETMDRDRFSWLSDEEFCRQMLAGLNPCSIQLVSEWPLMSKLDPEIYGPAESAITKEIVEKEIKDFMTFDEALAQKKLFMLDYHDLLLPYVNKLRDLKTTTLYGSRTLMFLHPDGTLKPIAIELTHQPYDGKPAWKHVYTPAQVATDLWLWRLAKAHVLAHDAGYHQLISHWLRTHCAIEPYIIATNRHLSQMHPMSRLLLPHCRYTMQINSLARLILINAGGILEKIFFPDEYSMQLSSDVYDQLWRFDHEALPADLINRGIAVEDPTAPHGLKLAIEDYPYANDGLLIYDAIKQWATSYVNHYYPQANLVESDEELQAWWNDIRTVGHGDKKDEPWWPQLKTQDDLIGIVSTIMWVTAGQHSAVNFGQYDLGGYIPYRPTVARTNMPNEDPTDEEWKSFIDRPEDALLKCFPSQLQGIQMLVLYDILSSHSPDEEYIGGNTNATWEAEPTIKAAFEEFRGRLNELEAIIDSRNTDPNLKNRCGAGLVPYQLFKPYSESGVTGRGVANSISI
ncbi:putative linoleate 13S-lipoxygenase [Helianthus annuus]|nr:putative linoleate 13S-lipoxygenase [Helianthus annuus]